MALSNETNLGFHLAAGVDAYLTDTDYIHYSGYDTNSATLTDFLNTISGDTGHVAYASNVGTSTAHLSYTNLKDLYDWWNLAANNDGTGDAINRWKEVEAFLNGITDTQTLSGLLLEKVSKTGDTMSGALVVNNSITANSLSITGSSTFNSPISGDLLGTATSANRLTVNAGSSTVPVYFSSGVPVVCNLSTTYAAYNSNGYLPLNGGTLTGSLTVNGVNNSIIWNADYNTGPWARSIFQITDIATATTKFNLAAYGNTDGLQYIYLGSNGYDSANNLRIYSDKVTWGTTKLSLDGHTHNYLKTTGTINATRTEGSSTVNNSLNNIISSGKLTFDTFKQGVQNSPGTITGDGYVLTMGWGEDNKYCEQLAFGADKQAMAFRYCNGSGTWGDWQTIYHSGNFVAGTNYVAPSGSITGNAGTATKLQTGRYLWGNLFDGSANVTGTIAASKIYINGTPSEYSASNTYALNTYVTYLGKVYKCTTAIGTAEAWTAGHWTEVANYLYNQNDTYNCGTTSVGHVYLREASTIGFRDGNSGYYTNLKYDTGGNEALVLSMKNAVTSFIIKSGDTGVTSPTTVTGWTSLVPSLQVKKQSVYINELIGNNVTPTYNFKVNGNSFIGTIGTASTASAAGTGYFEIYNRNAASATSYKTTIQSNTGTSNITLTLPSSTGTLALVGDNAHTHKWANVDTSASYSYQTEPEFKSMKLGNGTTTTATEYCKQEYDTTTKCLKFIFV